MWEIPLYVIAIFFVLVFILAFLLGVYAGIFGLKHRLLKEVEQRARSESTAVVPTKSPAQAMRETREGLEEMMGWGKK